MSTIEEIKQAVVQLAPEDFAMFRSWYLDYDAKLWDEQFERDARSGKLDRIAERAIQQYQFGEYTEL